MVKKVNEDFDRLLDTANNLFDVDDYNPTWFMKAADEFIDEVTSGSATPELVTKSLYRDARSFNNYYDSMLEAMDKYHDLAQEIVYYYESEKQENRK